MNPQESTPSDPSAVGILPREVVLRGVSFRPGLFLAPLAGITHSAFRRLVADFGGCGGYWTEMLAARRIPHENPRTSPFLRRSPREERVVYQLMLSSPDRLDAIFGRLAEAAPDAIDVNLACHAPLVRLRDAGSGLFDDPAALAAVLEAVRVRWSGLLLVKIRLGTARVGWEERLAERVRIIEQSGVDALVFHPRFFEERLRRRARHELLAWLATLTRLPLIANGDITGADYAARHAAVLRPACALMVGRMAVVQPWVFAAWGGRPVAVDPGEVWRRLWTYAREDFAPHKALARVKIFTEYYARNFRFGHTLFTTVQNADTLDVAWERAAAFFDRAPALDPDPSVLGL